MKKYILTAVISSILTSIIIIIGYKIYQYQEYTTDRFYAIYFDVDDITDDIIPKNIRHYNKKAMPVRAMYIGFMGKKYQNAMAISLSVTTYYKKNKIYRSADILYECIIKIDLNPGDVVQHGDLIGIVDTECERELEK